jgi:hypothetical protein
MFAFSNFLTEIIPTEFGANSNTLAVFAPLEQYCFSDLPLAVVFLIAVAFLNKRSVLLKIV